MARRGELTLPHGKVQTPVFQPCGTYGTVKAITPDRLVACGTVSYTHLTLPTIE